ncbi:MAG: Rrf2 family transcriptional regulator [Bacteroidales bacterium]
MNFSKTTSYSLNILSFMARNPETRVSADSLHRQLGIPYQYLRQLLTNLSKDGIITSERGRNGGFILGRDSRKIFLIDILRISEGEDIMSRCIMGFKKCPFDSFCQMHNLWVDARKSLMEAMEKTSLFELSHGEKLN